MPTLEQLKQEKVWRDQFVPPNLRLLASRLDARYDPGSINIGTYGDYRHLRGYHRSRRWIRISDFCTDRSYSIVETQGNRDGGDDDWISGIDIVVGYEISNGIFQRVTNARRRGRISYVRQCILERAPWHVHLSLDRGHANDDHSELFDIITGSGAWEGKMVQLTVGLPQLEEGSEGADVVTAQGLVTARGFATKLDGQFGPHTKEQTMAMQRHYGAEEIDGIWGPETWTIGITGEDSR